MQELQNVTVTVPVNRLSEFYAMLSRLLANDDSSQSTKEITLVPFADADVDTVVRWWGLLSASAKRVFEFLGQSPGALFRGSEIAAACQISSPNGVAGTLSWPGKHAAKLGLHFPLHWHAATGEYSMDSDVSRLMDLARKTVNEEPV